MSLSFCCSLMQPQKPFSAFAWLHHEAPYIYLPCGKTGGGAAVAVTSQAAISLQLSLQGHSLAACSSELHYSRGHNPGHLRCSQSKKPLFFGGSAGAHSARTHAAEPGSLSHIMLMIAKMLVCRSRAKAYKAFRLHSP